MLTINGYLTYFSTFFFKQSTPCTLKLPSTPDAEYLPELLNTPDRDEIQSLQLYLKQQHQQSQLQQQQKDHLALVNQKLAISSAAAAAAAAAVSNQENRKLVDLHQISSQASRKNFSTPESSQTDSDDVSPQIQRKRKTIHARDVLPRFSISIDDDHNRLVSCFFTVFHELATFFLG